MPRSMCANAAPAVVIGPAVDDHARHVELRPSGSAAGTRRPATRSSSPRGRRARRRRRARTCRCTRPRARAGHPSRQPAAQAADVADASASASAAGVATPRPGHDEHVQLGESVVVADHVSPSPGSARPPVVTFARAADRPDLDRVDRPVDHRPQRAPPCGRRRAARSARSRSSRAPRRGRHACRKPYRTRRISCHRRI